MVLVFNPFVADLYKKNRAIIYYFDEFEEPIGKMKSFQSFCRKIQKLSFDVTFVT